MFYFLFSILHLRSSALTLTGCESDDSKIDSARSEKDITRVSGTLSPSSILGGRTKLILRKKLANYPQAQKRGLPKRLLSRVRVEQKVRCECAY